MGSAESANGADGAATEPLGYDFMDGQVDGVDIDAVHQAVLACPAVAAIGTSLAGALATYLPGRRVPGIRVNPDSVEIEVSTRWGYPVREAVAEIRAGLEGLVAGRRIDVKLVDIQLPESEIR